MLVALASHSRQDEQTTDVTTDNIKNYLTVEESILNHVCAACCMTGYSACMDNNIGDCTACANSEFGGCSGC
ncbi:unnamed protein product [Adineta steineri]|uniref:Uncharacterized protein n=1 Tax=Adineta steineri TaxID=433720 RepID=A0A818Q8Q2_9BILA|nr:unnamed protein product [Adineta steineri]